VDEGKGVIGRGKLEVESQELKNEENKGES